MVEILLVAVGHGEVTEIGTVAPHGATETVAVVAAAVLGEIEMEGEMEDEEKDDLIKRPAFLVTERT